MSVFEHLARDDAREQERVSGNRAIIAVQARVQDRFSAFVANAAGPEDRDARLSLLDDEIRDVVAAVCEEYDFNGDQDIIHTAARDALGAGHPAGCDCGFCKNKGKLFDKDDEGEEEETKESHVKTACGCCEDCGGEGCSCSNHKESKTANEDYPGHDYSIEGGEYVKNWVPEEDQEAAPSEDESNKDAWHNAKVASKTVSMFHEADGFTHCDCGCKGCDDGNHCESDECISTKRGGNGRNNSGEKSSAAVETGDTFTSETFDLGSSSGKDGVQDVGSPKIDKAQVPGGSGIPGEGGLSAIDVPSKQHPVEVQDIHDTPDYWEAPIGPSETGKAINADTPLQPEFNVAPGTQTWTGTEGLATPVTSSVKWQILT